MSIEKVLSKKFDSLFVDLPNSQKFIATVTPYIPRASSVVLEINLMRFEYVDVSFRLNRKSDDFIFFMNNKHKDSLIGKDCRWKGIYDFLDLLTHHPKFSYINDVWFEFDEENYGFRGEIVPGVCIQVCGNYDVIWSSLNKIYQREVPEKTYHALKSLIASLPFESELMYIGVFLGRERSPLRLSIMLNLKDVQKIISRFHIDKELSDLFDKLRTDITEEIILDLDVDLDSNKPIVVQGIEIRTDTWFKWLKIFDLITIHGWCQNSSMLKVLSWIQNTPVNVIRYYEEENPTVSLNKLFPKFILHSILHLKLSTTNGKKAKIYLMEGYYW